MTKLHLVLCFLLATAHAVAFAQTEKDCQEIMRKADSAIADSNYNLALTELRAFKICNPALAGKADDKIAGVFNRIKAQRDTANAARRRADIATGVALQEKARAQTAQAAAERQAYLAQLAAMSSRLLLVNKEEPTLAFRLASLAYDKNPSLENAAILHDIISDTSNGLAFTRINTSAPTSAFDDENGVMTICNGYAVYSYDSSATYLGTDYLPVKFPRHYAMAPTSRFIAMDDSTTIYLYHIGDQSLQQKAWSGSPVAAISWSHDGKFVFVRDRRGFRVLDSALNTVYHYTDSLLIAFDMSDDLHYLALSHPSEVILRDSAAEGEKDTLHEPNVDLLVVNDEGLCTTRRAEKTIKIWTRGDDEKFTSQTFTSHSGPIQSIYFVPSTAAYFRRANILSSSEDGFCILWTADRRIIRTMKNPAGNRLTPFHVILSTRGQRIITSSDNTLWLWDLKTNPLGELTKHKPNDYTTDYLPGIQTGRTNTGFWVSRGDSIREYPYPAEETVFDIKIVDNDRLLLYQRGAVTLFDVPTGRSTPLLQQKDAWMQTAVNPAGDILVRDETSVLYYDRNGGRKGKINYKFYQGAFGMNPATKEIIALEFDKICKINPSTGDTIHTWPFPKEPYFANHTVQGLEFSPAGDFILLWTENRAILYDTAWRRIKDYDPGVFNRARFSFQGDSIYFCTVSGTLVYYTLSGLRRSKQIYDLSIADKLKFKVPGYLKEIIHSGRWSDFDQCISYFYFDYLNTGNDADLDQLEYLYSQSSRFFQKSLNYLENLDVRIVSYDGFARPLGPVSRPALERIMGKMAAQLKKEKTILLRLHLVN